MVLLSSRGFVPTLLLTLFSLALIAPVVSAGPGEIPLEGSIIASRAGAPEPLQDDEQLRREIMEKVERELQKQRERLMQDIDRMIRDTLRRSEGRDLRRAHRHIEELEQEIKELRAQLSERGERRGRRAERAHGRERNEAGHQDEPAILGLGFEDTDAELARRLDADPANCLQVTTVIEGSPCRRSMDEPLPVSDHFWIFVSGLGSRCSLAVGFLSQKRLTR